MVADRDGLVRLALDVGVLERAPGGVAWLEVRVRARGEGGRQVLLAPRQRVDRAVLDTLPPAGGRQGGMGMGASGERPGAGLSASSPKPAGASGSPVLTGTAGQVVPPAVPEGGAADGSRAWLPAGGPDGPDGGPWVVSGTNIYYTAGNVGIGLTAPGYPLHVKSSGGRAIHGWDARSSGESIGVVGQSSASPSGIGVYGVANASSGVTFGVFGRSTSTSGIGVYGQARATSGETYGVYGQNESQQGAGVFGWARATSGSTYGVAGVSDSTSGIGVRGVALATTGPTSGVYGQNSSQEGRGVFGVALATSGITYGVYGESRSQGGRGVFGWTTATSGTTYGVYGRSESTSGAGVFGFASSSDSSARGVLGMATSPAVAVYASGNSTTTGTKSFRIDHPLDPDNRYLNHHYCSEGPEPLNVYSGNVILDHNGQAWVDLPPYFEAINRDVRYQLTPVGGWAPVYVATEVAGNRFRIAGGRPGMKVSWRIEAVRNDRYVQRYGAPVEMDKPPEERGRYLHPELYGLPAERGVHWQEKPADRAVDHPVGRPAAAAGRQMEP